MHGGRGYLGWMAATTVGVTLSLVFLAVDKHIRLPQPAEISAPSGYNAATTTQNQGILLTVDPGLAGVEQYARTDQAPLDRTHNPLASETSTGNLLRKPPEPAANVVLQAPVPSFEFTELPLQTSRSGIEYLMEAMDQAFSSPLQVVSANKPSFNTPTFPIHSDRLAAVPSPASISGRIPQPTALLEELTKLQDAIHPIIGRTNANPRYVSTVPVTRVSLNEANAVESWVVQVQDMLERVVVHHGLEHPECAQEIGQLAALASQARELGNALTDYALAARVIRVGYALERRVTVWNAIQSCLDGTTIALNRPRSPELAREELNKSIHQVESLLMSTAAPDSWRKYLLLDELKDWSNSTENTWTVGNDLSLNVLSRLHWQRLSVSQKTFLNKPEFEELAAQLVAWGREPIDYRQLLTELEQFEGDPISRVNGSLAGAVQVLRLSDESKQKSVATSINDHYRNANIRLSLSDDLLQRFLPDGDFEARPVRQRILGADTRGNSMVKTQLDLTLLPDETGWNIGIGVIGDLYSSTRSSKGPAVFHNTSTAQINSHRYVRMDPMGYNISAEPTNVSSQDYLRNMSTDFDGLPVIGDFVRLLVREQFDQKRGIAQRITRRLIANETDAELDRRLEESLSNAERELQKRLVGPLERLSLNPMVVAMNTTEDRLTIRYRVANESQMAAHTPRPRAPTDSLLSMQLNQSAINNAIAQLGLGGKTWTLPELYAHLGSAFQQSNWKLPQDVSPDITIRFADTRPATVEMEDGRLRLTLRIAEISQPGVLHIERFIVSSNYIPVADGLSAELIRDGVVEIVSNHDRVALRVIFAKVFVSRPEIPLISETWQTDPRSEGLAVSQLEIRDGWLAVAISEAGSQLAAEVAAKARALRLE